MTAPEQTGVGLGETIDEFLSDPGTTPVECQWCDVTTLRFDIKRHHDVTHPEKFYDPAWYDRQTNGGTDR